MKKNVAPLPSLLSTQIRPPCARAIPSAIARPSPVPLYAASSLRLLRLLIEPPVFGREDLRLLATGNFAQPRPVSLHRDRRLVRDRIDEHEVRCAGFAGRLDLQGSEHRFVSAHERNHDVAAIRGGFAPSPRRARQLGLATVFGPIPQVRGLGADQIREHLLGMFLGEAHVLCALPRGGPERHLRVTALHLHQDRAPQWKRLRRDAKNGVEGVIDDLEGAEQLADFVQVLESARQVLQAPVGDPARGDSLGSHR